ncbi:hypothetical protein [Aquibium sp. ELW1220]|uniref:hypothetical protein n=1 Tax=Aquibium sp. ELW1220 TaxID=2976766 RepID=UPI0025AFB392|nr:hypothetical protein [Aquibium sp. ELW1220]MDN2583417.1 hypothetical protein [Aquibium sp. ELW1220]
MAEPADMILPLLREIQGEIASFRKEAADRFAALESGQRNIRSALAADTVLGRMLIGEYEERIGSLERKVDELERGK